MKTRIVNWTAAKPTDGPTYTLHYEVTDEPVSFDACEAHVGLGGRAIALQYGALYAVFEDQLGPTFPGIWPDCTFHLVVRSWQ